MFPYNIYNNNERGVSANMNIISTPLSEKFASPCISN